MITVLGSGSWGTALAQLVASNGYDVCLFARDPDVVEKINRAHENPKCHPGILLNPKILATENLEHAMNHTEAIIYAMPSHVVRHMFKKISTLRPLDIPWISTSKGIENESLLTQSLIAQDYFSANDLNRYFMVLSGPSFAYDVVRSIPTAVSLASKDPITLETVQHFFHGKSFQVFLSGDVLGVELAGALKNVIAIAAGAVDGFGLGQSTRAALISRGLTELARIGKAQGAKYSTFSGLSGLGDLVVTCTSDHSRNRRLGFLLAQKKSLREALKLIGQSAEGLRTCRSAYRLAKKLNIQAPIIEEIYLSLYGHKPMQDAIESILSRPPEAE